MKGRVVVAMTALALGCMCARAHAAPTKADVDAAQKLFDEGLSLMDAKRYAEACPKLAQSQKLDPGMGTKFRLAECYEAAGLTGSAWKLFGEVSVEARTAGREDRAAQASDRAAALRPKVPWMTITVPRSVLGLEGLVVNRDGEIVPKTDLGREIAVDPGAHTITVSATGKKTWKQTVKSLEGGKLTVEVPPLADGSTGLAPQKIAAIVVGIVGLGGVATGIATGLLAKSAWADAKAGCVGGVLTQCPDDAIEKGKEAETLSYVSTVGFVVGGVAIAGAPVLWFTTPSDDSSRAALGLRVMFGQTSVATLEGRF